MGKILIVGAIICFIVYWSTTAINHLSDDKDRVVLTRDEILVLNKLSIAKKKALWNNSTLKSEMLGLFPHFMEMKDFVENHIEDDGTFKDDLGAHIEEIEFKYIAGSLSGQSARAALSNF